MASAARPWPAVGRRGELGVFTRALSSGEHAGQVIHGRAGVGKSRLAEECRQQARRRCPGPQCPATGRRRQHAYTKLGVISRAGLAQAVRSPA